MELKKGLICGPIGVFSAVGSPNILNIIETVKLIGVTSKIADHLLDFIDALLPPMRWKDEWLTEIGEHSVLPKITNKYE